MSELSAEQIADLARQSGLKIDAARAEGFRAGLNSLLRRIARVGELLPREVAPPPNRAPE